MDVRSTLNCQKKTNITVKKHKRDRMNKPSMKILLVEDSPVACKLVRDILSNSSETIDLVVKTSGDLAGAIDLLDQESFEVVLLDLGLPDSDGIDTVKRVHASSPDIPIIVLTGSDDQRLGIEAIKEGAEDYIIKRDLSIHIGVRTILYAVERKKMKQSLIKAQKELEVRVQERTVELAQANKKLEATVEQLTLSNIELQDFAHVVAHDLKSPVRAIGTLANWLAADSTEKFDKTVRENLDLLLVRAEHMNKMIDGILQYSGLGRNENIIKKQVDLNKLVSRVIQDVCPDNNISIEVESNLPSITCEEIRLSQIFQNLLDNAIKYLDKPKGQIKVGCIDDHDYWRFFVADNGSGIEEKFLDKIFDLFETLHSIDDQESVGLGLSLVKKIIEIYGGRIWAESELGDGSTFFFTLPKKERISTDETVKANTFS